MWTANLKLSSAKIHMHILNMFILYTQSFKLIASKLWEELITQTFLFFKGATDGQRDRPTDAQGQNIMPPDIVMEA